MNFSTIDRRKFLRASGFALALPWFETFASSLPSVSSPKKRLACFYVPDGGPMPLSTDPAFEDWAWFPHGDSKNYRFSKCLEPIEPMRNDITIFSGLSKSGTERMRVNTPWYPGETVMEFRIRMGETMRFT